MQSHEEIGPLAAAPEHIFTRTNGSNRVTLRISGNLICVEIVGEALDYSLVECFREALSCGVVGLNMQSLVDLSHFNGTIDWGVLHAVFDLAPWGTDPGPARVAYVTRSTWFKALLKLVSVLFPRNQHRQFPDAESAMRWLTSGK